MPARSNSTSVTSMLALGIAALSLWLGACSIRSAPVPVTGDPRAQPEAATGYTAKAAVRANRYMAASANPLATEAALEILRKGGSAVDAAIAAQMVLTLVEPQSSGIGGGAFLMHYDAASKSVSALDGRETAPLAATESLFLDRAGKPLSFIDAVVGGRAVGVPGALAMQYQAHQQHGRLPWARLFDSAIRWSEEGFVVSPRLHALLKGEKHLSKDPVAASYFYQSSGEPWPIGHRLRNPALANTLKAIAAKGPDALLKGEIARDIVAKVREHPSNPGVLTESDLANYQARTRTPICHPYLRYVVCGFPPPSSGGIAVAQILSAMEHLQSALGPAVLADRSGSLRAEGVHRLAEAGRLAYADRGLYIADPDFIPWPPALLDPRYLAQRARLIEGARSIGRASPGQPQAQTSRLTHGFEYEERGTSHISVVDANGNAVAMTTTIEDVFGARQMVRGFLLNNELTDFSFTPKEGERDVANRVQAGKRPRSSMAPTLVFEKDSKGDRGALLMTLGSPGGSQIINYVAKTLVATLADGLDPQAAISLPNIGSRNGPTELEALRAPASLRDTLLSRGHEVRQIDMTSGLQAIIVERRAGSIQLVGGADPRREGTVMGD